MHLSFSTSFNDVTRINFRFRLFVTLSSPHGHDAFPYKIWCIVYIFIHSGVIDIFPKIQDGGSRHLRFSGYVNLVIPACWWCGICVLYQIWFKYYSHWDRHTYTSDNHLMTSRELTSGFDFWSRGHLRMAVTHLPVKFGADIFIQSGVIDIFPKFKMAAAAILDFQIMWIWLFGCVDSVVFVFCTKLG